jgi:hypothetical protein
MATGLEAPDDAAQIDTPFEIDADLIHLVGDRLLEARGRVEITRDDLLSYGDSVSFQQDVGLLTLYRNARIISPDEESGDTLDLRADTITMILPMDVMEELNAVGRAHLLTDAVDIRGPTIRLLFTDEVLNRIVAATASLPNPPEGPSEETPSGGSGEEGPRAVAEEFILTGDSIDVRLPGGELETVFAIGAARGVSAARDSINSDDTPELIRHDWIEGDTITATFVTRPPSSGGALDAFEDPSEAAGERRLDRLVAQGEARSFYRTTSDTGTGTGIANSTPDSGPLELNYVLGNEIRLFMQDGEVDRMEVDQASGAFFQPNGASQGPPPPAVDTTAARPTNDRRRTP